MAIIRERSKVDPDIHPVPKVRAPRLTFKSRRDDGEGARPASAKSHTFSIPVRQLATSRSKTG